jgi:hypothetical protein
VRIRNVHAEEYAPGDALIRACLAEGSPAARVRRKSPPSNDLCAQLGPEQDGDDKRGGQAGNASECVHVLTPPFER